jgi:hypothetical protein
MKSVRLIIPSIILTGSILFQSCKTENKVIWKIGEADNSAAEFCLAPNDYKRFLEKDFGWEDRYFLIGKSDTKNDFPYVLPGPADEWGGTWSTAGWRSHTLNILFGIEKLPDDGNWKLMIDLLGISSKEAPLFKVTINGKSWNLLLKFPLKIIC